MTPSSIYFEAPSNGARAMHASTAVVELFLKLGEKFVKTFLHNFSIDNFDFTIKIRILFPGSMSFRTLKNNIDELFDHDSFVINICKSEWEHFVSFIDRHT